MTDHEDMLSTPEELLEKPCDQWCELEILSAHRAIKELVAERNHWEDDALQRAANTGYWRDRAEKAEADLAAARAYQDDVNEVVQMAMKWAMKQRFRPEGGLSGPLWDAIHNLRDKSDTAIAAARAEGGE